MDDRIEDVFSQAVAEAYLLVEGEGLAAVYRLLTTPSADVEQETPLPIASTA